MSSKKLSIRYAQAFYALAKEKGVRKAVFEDSKELLALYQKAPFFRRFIESPLQNALQKRAIFTKCFEGKFDPATFTFMLFLFSKRRENYLKPILNDFQNLYHQAEKINTVYLSVAGDLSSQVKQALSKHMKNLTTDEGEILLHVKKDPTLIGGYVLKTNNKQLDMSIRTQLSRLKNHWDQTPFLENKLPTT